MAWHKFAKSLDLMYTKLAAMGEPFYRTTGMSANIYHSEDVKNSKPKIVFSLQMM